MAPTIHRWPNSDSLFDGLLVSLEEGLAPGNLVALPTGGTPLPLYERLRERSAESGIWRKLQYLQLDEYVEEPVGSERFADYLRREILDPLDIPRERRHLVPSGASPEDAAAMMDARLAEHGPLALALLGLGHNGHIAFNEPADELPPCYHTVRLSDDTVRRNLPALGDRPMHAVTISVAQILSAAHVVLVVPQEDKQSMLEKALAGPPSPRIPASLICGHANADVHVIDEGTE